MVRHRAPVGWPAQRATSADDREAGSAVVEFLGVTLLLLVPVVYLVLVLGRIQAATFAVEGAARESARALVTAPDAATGAELAATATAIALVDQGFSADLAEGALTVACAPDCHGAGSTVSVAVEVEVPLPGVPAFVAGVVPLSVPVSATVTTTPDRFAAPGAS